MKRFIFLFFIISMIFVIGCTQESSVAEKKQVETEEVLDIPKEIQHTDGVKDDILEERVEDPTPIEEPLPPVEEPTLINGKTVDVRLKEAYDMLHKEGSEQHIRDNFLDLEIVYTDFGDNSGYGDDIYPFNYYYSAEADATFNLCNVARTVFICEGKLDRMITDEDMDSGRCIVTPIYQL